MPDITFALKAKNEAQRAVNGFTGDMRRAGKSTKTIRDEATRARKETDRLGKRAGETARRFDKTALAAKGVRTALGGIAAIIGGLAIGQVFAEGVRSAREFEAALAEVGTLIEGTDRQIEAITDASSEFARTFGGTASAQAAGFYQTISAGVSDVAEATVLLEQANKLAVGGITDVTTAVDILTTAVNAYGPDVITAEEASDSLFVAMKAGKTTVGELASSLGQVIPVAASVGISFDELNATVATLTTRGVTTQTAVTGLRGILAAIIKPTKEAEDAAKDLGIAFNSAAVAGAGGLVPFLVDLLDKTDGNVDTLARLFGGVEALVPILSLAGGGAADLANILEDLEDKAGATDEAFLTISENLDQRLKVATSDIAESFRRIGRTLLSALTPALEALAFILRTITENAQSFGIALAVLASTQIPRLVAAIRALGVGLTAINALFIAGSTASLAFGRALAFASKALKGIAVFAVITGVIELVRLLKDVKASAADYSEGLDQAEAATRRLDQALFEFNRNRDRSTVKAVEVAADNARNVVESAIQSTVERINQLSKLNFLLTLNLFDIPELKEARAELEGLQRDLIDLETAASAASNATSNIELSSSGAQSIEEVRQRLNQLGITGEAAERILENLRGVVANTPRDIKRLAQAVVEVDSVTSQNIPTLATLRGEYGQLAETVRDNIVAQNRLAEVTGRIEIGNAIGEAAKNLEVFSNQVGATELQTLALQEQLLRIRELDTFGQQAEASSRLANEILNATNNGADLTAEGRKAVAELLKASQQAANLQANADRASGAISGAAGNAAGLANNMNEAAAAANRFLANLGRQGSAIAGLRAEVQALEGGGTDIDAAVARREAEIRSSPDFQQNLSGPPGKVAEAYAFLNKELTQTRERLELAARSSEIMEERTKALSAATGSGGSSAGGGSSTKAESNLSQAISGINSRYRELAETAGLTGRAVEEYRIKQELLTAAKADGITLSPQVIESVLAQKRAYEEAARAADTFANGARQGFEGFANSVQTNMEFARDFTQNAFQGLSDTIANFVKTGKFSFKSLIADLLGQISQFLANRLVIDFLGINGDFTGGSGGKGTLDFLGGLFKGAFGGGLAEGGPAKANTPYVVGEVGPELFIPKTAGTVIPNRQLEPAAGGGSDRPINLTFNITTPDVDGFNRSRGQIEAQMSEAFARSNRRNN